MTENIGTVKAMRKTSIQVAYGFETLQLEIEAPGPVEMNDQAYRNKLGFLEAILDGELLQFRERMKPHIQPTQSPSITNVANQSTGPLKTPKSESGGWRPWKSGKGGESKPATEDRELADYLLSQGHDSKNPYDGQDNFRYWIMKTDDGRSFIHRIKRRQ
jgi:hypothetical protein